MIKYLFIIFNSLAFFIYHFFTEQSAISVTNNIPAKMVAGNEVQIELKITKGTMSGFAKFQLDLPDGIAVKKTENRGANYSYGSGIAKWVWASLPVESEIAIQLTLISAPDATGLKTINGKFSYIEDNKKRVVEMAPAEVTFINPDGNSAEESNPTVSNKSSDSAKTSVPANVESSAPQQNAATTSNEPPGKVNVSRKIIKGNNNEYLINISIIKDGTKGFARYSDDIPEGFTAKSLKTDGSSFSVSDGKLKFVWVNVPEKNELELSYFISGNVSAKVILAGEYSYLEDNLSKKFTLEQERIEFIAMTEPPKEIKSEQPTENNSITTINNDIKYSEPPITDVPSKSELKVDEKTNETDKRNTKSKEAMMEKTLTRNLSAVDYHVQIGAFTNGNVNASKLKKVFHVNETITSEMQDGFSKFMVGNHADYKEARDHREQMKSNNGIKSSFVVAYNTGKRITVQEALMITNQKWFK
jgi:hypothetical protein